MVMNAISERIEDFLGRIKYNHHVSKEKHEKSLAMSTSFLEELIDFFKTDLPSKARILKLEPNQWNILHYFLDMEPKGLINNIGNSKFLINSSYCLLRSYLLSKEAPSNYKYPGLNLIWNVSNESPSFIEFMPLLYSPGDKSLVSEGELYFWPFPEKIKNTEQLLQLLQKKGDFEKEEDEKILVYDRGNRILRSWDEQAGTGDLIIDNYYFLGGFNSKALNQDCWLYGCNDALQKGSDESSSKFLTLRARFL